MRILPTLMFSSAVQQMLVGASYPCQGTEALLAVNPGYAWGKFYQMGCYNQGDPSSCYRTQSGLSQGCTDCIYDRQTFTNCANAPSGTCSGLEDDIAQNCVAPTTSTTTETTTTTTETTTTTTTPSPCSSYTDPIACNGVQCFWYNDACNDASPQTCDILVDGLDCLHYECAWNWEADTCASCSSFTSPFECPCFWYSDSCIFESPTCSSLTNRTECFWNGCMWYDNACSQELPLTCNVLTNLTDCLTYQCSWRDGLCYGVPVPCANLTSSEDCLANNCGWNIVNNQCSVLAPGICSNFDDENFCLIAGCTWDSSAQTCSEASDITTTTSAVLEPKLVLSAMAGLALLLAVH
jgi:hypothetical protein